MPVKAEGKKLEGYQLLIWAFLLINGPLLILNQFINSWMEFIGVFFNLLIAPFAWVVIVWELTRNIFPSWIENNVDVDQFAMYFAPIVGPVVAYASYPTFLYLHSNGLEQSYDFSNFYSGFTEFMLTNSPFFERTS